MTLNIIPALSAGFKTLFSNFLLHSTRTENFKYLAQQFPLGVSLVTNQRRLHLYHRRKYILPP